MLTEQEGCRRAVFCMVKGAEVIACAGRAIGLVSCTSLLCLKHADTYRECNANTCIHPFCFDVYRKNNLDCAEIIIFTNQLFSKGFSCLWRCNGWKSSELALPGTSVVTILAISNFDTIWPWKISILDTIFKTIGENCHIYIQSYRSFVII